MKADLTRDTFHAFKHFSRVLMQQGRVQLDADWNEQAAILLRYLRALVADLIGPQGGPVDSTGVLPAFEIIPLLPTHTPPDFQFWPGHYYVDGILCEADATPVSLIVPQGAATNVVQVQNWMPDGTPLSEIQYVEIFDAAVGPPYTYHLAQISNADPVNRQLTLSSLPVFLANASPSLRRAYTYLTQPDLPSPPPLASQGSPYQVYLDVWERHITYVEDDTIREVALGGPDTATRAKVIWQVKLTAACRDNQGNPVCCTADYLANKFQPPNRGWLSVQVEQAAQTADPCIVPPTSRYRGQDNQLYRVEIHSGSFDSHADPIIPTFKWSRENGSVVFPIMKLTPGGGTTTVILENLGRDDRFGLREGDWVEVQDDDSVLQNRPDNLLVIQSIDRTAVSVTLTGQPTSSVGTDPTKHPLLRRWDEKAGDPAENGLTLSSVDNSALIRENLWLELENGVQIWFQKADDTNNPNTYRTGDYWLIPARTATGNVEWPTGADAQGNPVPIAKPPDGVTHHYAPLWVISVAADGGVTVIPPDCRKRFTPVAKGLALRPNSVLVARNNSGGASNSTLPPLAAVTGIGEARAERLAKSGIDSVPKLAAASPVDVAHALKGAGVSTENAAGFIEKAKKLMPPGKKE